MKTQNYPIDRATEYYYAAFDCDSDPRTTLEWKWSWYAVWGERGWTWWRWQAPRASAE